MTHLITELSKYLMIFLIMFYAYYSFAVLGAKDETRRRKMFRRQAACMFILHLDAFLVIFANQMELRYLFFYAAQVLFVVFLFVVYKRIYKKADWLVVNHMCMLMLIGFIILTRMDLSSALRQFEIAVVASVITIFVPLFIKKFKSLRKFTWLYAVIGIVALAAVLLFGRMTGGAYISFTIAGITLQPSEFVKIIFVFFVACMLYSSTNFKQVLITTIVAAVHVIILVLSTDLGSALIFFITYVIMVFVATRKPAYLAAGAGIGVVAWVAAARLFSHVRVRVQAWRDPFANIEGGGWQIAQSLFAIGTGGWFGVGLFQGLPNNIPVASSDFVFSAITEEMGILFGICIILICFSCFMMFLNIALQIKDQFYKLIALGLGCVYGIQVFLNIGGVIKLIPSTGLTLPLVSYGGSSIFCTIIIFAIIQGLYIMRPDEGEKNEQRRQHEQQSRKPAETGSGDGRSGVDRSGQPLGEEYPEQFVPEPTGEGSKKPLEPGYDTEEDYEEIW